MFVFGQTPTHFNILTQATPNLSITLLAQGWRSSALQMTPKVSGGWPLLETSSSQSEPSSLVPCSAFPGPRVIHIMLMTLTLLIMAKQPNLKPCGAPAVASTPQHLATWVGRFQQQDHVLYFYTTYQYPNSVKLWIKYRFLQITESLFTLGNDFSSSFSQLKSLDEVLWEWRTFFFFHFLGPQK